MNVDSVGIAMTKDNPTYNGFLWDEIKSIPLALTFNAGFSAHPNDISKYSSTTLSQGNIHNDEVFNKILRDMIQAYPVTSPDFASGWAWYSFYLYNVILNATFYQIDMISDVLMHPTIMDTTTSNFAVRLHNFTGDYADGKLIYSIVDVVTGNEAYRVTTNESAGSAYSQYNANFLRNVRRVNNGVIDLTTPLTLADELKIISCIPLSVNGEYHPYWDYVWAIHTDANGKQQKDVNPNKLVDATTAYQAATHGFPFQDGNTGDLLLKPPRMIAIDKPDSDKGSYILGWSFLPWNNSKYYIFDLMANQYKGISPISTENFMTILKLILLGILFGEIIGLIRKGKLSLNFL